MVSDETPLRLADAIASKFGERWDIRLEGVELSMRHRQPAGPVVVPRAAIPTGRMLTLISAEFARFGIAGAPLLPLKWGRDTDVLISAIQGLDPWLKDAQPWVYREGFIPQPVVRFTGDRDSVGHLRDGFLTAFVNVSCVQRVASIQRFVELLDAWISALGALGIYAGRLTIRGELRTWSRGPVSGLTLFCDCDGIGVSDAVLLWNTASPDHMATDIGSGLERLSWLVTGSEWAHTVFGEDADMWSTDVLDAVRTATLMTMSSIRPSGRGPGGALRRVLDRIPPAMAAAGLGRLVRSQRRYWTTVGVTGPPWPNLSTAIEDGVLARAQR
ncbi:hypothetical protein JOD54_001409 [Actinokineospora baliensis]|nr:hypothetical protein [Actinokineospora baliensis]